MMDIVFVDKKSENKEKTILRVDATNDGLGTCTVCQIIGAIPTFYSNSTFQDGTVTSIGTIKEWASGQTDNYDAYIFNGKKEYELKDYTGIEEETVTPSVENEGGDGDENGDGNA